MPFLFYLYTLLAADKLTVSLNETENPLPLKAEEGTQYAPFIQLLSRRELEVIEAAVSSLFNGYTSK